VSVVIDPFNDLSGASPVVACSSTTRRSTNVAAQLVLVTHEHADHNGVEAIGGNR
jgi:L-ascorbate metabolism protein UlaG (beta-lactamase superfamily)